MCTIMTLGFHLYSEQPEVYNTRMKADARANSEGFSLILMHEDESKSSVIRTMDFDVIDTCLNTMPWTRFFLHCRAATSSHVGVATTHAFQSDSGWFVMHNGVVSNPRTLQVDSQNIVKVLDAIGPAAAIEWLHKNESWANVFLVNPKTGHYYVSRSTGGVLHTDGQANYSTQPVAGLTQDVPVTSSKHWIVEVKAVSKYGKWVSSTPPWTPSVYNTFGNSNYQSAHQRHGVTYPERTTLTKSERRALRKSGNTEHIINNVNNVADLEAMTDAEYRAYQTKRVTDGDMTQAQADAFNKEMDFDTLSTPEEKVEMLDYLFPVPDKDVV